MYLIIFKNTILIKIKTINSKLLDSIILSNLTYQINKIIDFTTRITTIEKEQNRYSISHYHESTAMSKY